MPRVPFYSGPIASAVMPHSPVPPDTSLDPYTARRIGEGAGDLISRVFFPNAAKNSPEAQLARQRAAAAAVDEEKLAAAKRASAARGDLQGVLDEMLYRTGRGPSPSTAPDAAPLYEEAPYDRPTAAPISPEAEEAKLRALSAGAYRGALGRGGDADELSPILQSMFLQLGDDEGIVRANAALEGKYLGVNDSPSVGAQKEMIEDAQRQELEKQDMIERTKRYGFDLDYKASVYDTDVDATTSRRGQDQTDARVRRGQNLVDARVRDAADRQVITTTTETPASRAVPEKSKLFGIFGEDRPAQPARLKTRTTVRRTVRRPSAPGGGGRPPLSAFGN